MAKMPVVAAVDGSEESMRAAEWAAREAQRHRAPLRIVSVPAMPPRMRAYDGAPGTVAGEVCGKSVRALSAAVTRAEEVSSRLPVDTGLLTGPPALAVTDSGSGALMLVVGARGTGGFGALLLGSVSRYAAMHASCPVIVVREETGAAHLEIVVGVRDLQDGSAILAFAFEEAHRRGATLVAVHSWDGLPPATWHPADPEQLAAEAYRNLTETLRPWHDKYPAVRVRQDVLRDHPARVLASYTTRADLVVIGRHGHGTAVGGIEHAVLSHARGPVAIVPSG
jgi:nucleotide-binding universal stress UspA family protein